MKNKKQFIFTRKQMQDAMKNNKIQYIKKLYFDNKINYSTYKHYLFLLKKNN